MKSVQNFSFRSFSFLVIFAAFSAVSFADLPGNLKCISDQGETLPINNQQVLTYKKTTADQFKTRGLVQGLVTQLYADATGHTHFAIDLNGDRSGDLEVIYNDDFGELPILKVGMTVIACGDYITVGPRARLPSPMGAIIHWVHYNPGDRDGGRHPHGFLVIQGKPYGFPAQR